MSQTRMLSTPKLTYPRCNKCLWWESYAGYKGQCYAHPVLPLFSPPDSGADDADVILWPTTSEDDRCPEFCEHIKDDYADPSEES